MRGKHICEEVFKKQKRETSILEHYGWSESIWKKAGERQEKEKQLKVTKVMEREA